MPGTQPLCPNCGWPADEPFETLSRHRTSEGTVIYHRCACGAIRIRLTPNRFQGDAGDLSAATRKPRG
ncbi:hypothetical protein [Nocardia yamanashiensis]|uniref:hypothetical protein n=1 Tax=Nocardia yamanashiensis TaxID=209247 RepID=UPI0008373844|nr:hypothetical protein [Nocardia yamanashiensis]